MLKVYYVTGTMQSPLCSLLNLILGMPRGINTVNLTEKLRHKKKLNDLPKIIQLLGCQAKIPTEADCLKNPYF